MKTIAFHTQKGGAGKTTLTGNIAYYLASQGKKILIVDFDSSQGNLLTWAWSEQEERQPNYEVGDYLNSLNLARPTETRDIKKVIFNLRENLDILPTFGIGSSLKEYIISKINLPQEQNSIGTLIKESQELGYDFIFFDLSPSMMSLEQRITFFVDEIILVTPASFFGMDGVIINNKENERLKDVQETLRKKPLIRNKIILNNFDKRYNRHLKAKESLELSGANFWVVRTSSLVDNLQGENKFLFETELTHEIMNDYKEIANIILKEAN